MRMRFLSAMLLIFSCTFCLSCRTAPYPDPYEEYRRSLQEEIGELDWSGWPQIQSIDAVGENERQYREYFHIDWPELEQTVYYRLGTVSWQNGLLGVQVFLPREASQGTIFFAPGYLAQSGIFSDFIQYLCQQGFAVIAFDLPGHGISSGDRADIDSFENYGNAAAALVDFVQQKKDVFLEQGLTAAQALPQPWYAVGHSTGGATFMIFAEQKRRQQAELPFRAYALLSPLVRPVFWTPAIVFAHISYPIRRHFRPLKQSPELLGVETFPSNWAFSLSRWRSEIDDYAQFDFPVFLSQGGRDTTLNYKAGTRFVREHFPQTESHFYPELGHIIHQTSPLHRAVWQDMVRFFQNLSLIE